MHPFFNDPWLLYHFIISYPDPKMLRSFMIVFRNLNKYIKDQNLQDKLYNCLLKKRSDTYCERKIFQAAQFFKVEYSILPNQELHGVYQKFCNQKLIVRTEFYRNKDHGLHQELLKEYGYDNLFLREEWYVNGIVKGLRRTFYTGPNVVTNPNIFPTKISLFCEKNVHDNSNRYWYENGTLMIESNGLTGVKAWHPNGTLAAIVKYVPQSGVVGQTWGPDGSPIDIKNLPDELSYWIYHCA